MKFCLLLILCLGSLDTKAQQADYYLKSYNPHIQEKEIAKIDPTIKVVKDSKSLSLRTIDDILKNVELNDLLKKYDNVDRYLVAQKCLGHTKENFINSYKQFDNKKLATFCKELKKLWNLLFYY